MATKAAAVYQFFSSFGLPAYVNTNVPDNATFPYLTYTYAVSAWDTIPVSLTVNLWYKTTSEVKPNEKAEEIGKYIDEMSPISCDDGYIWFKRGSPWSQSFNDDTVDNIKRRYINVTVEYLTAH